ncbi:reverse transcriptase-like protein [Candidatus Parcubacteria bacterium]|nr:reverse transcriptase-like protein [Candidatus Parcubacteria bacterium]
MWQKTEKLLYRKFKFKDFDEAIEFINNVAEIAKRANHHPTITNTYNTVELELSTHSAGGTVTKKDEDFAARVDELFNADRGKDNKLKTAKLYTDGGSRGNPGPSAIGIALLDENDEVIIKTSRYIGITTNNQAEYQAIKKGLELAKEIGIKRLAVFMDSELIIKQIKGEYKVKNAELAPHYHVVKELEKNFSEITFQHILRENNKLADFMVNECLDAAEKNV